MRLTCVLTVIIASVASFGVFAQSHLLDYADRSEQDIKRDASEHPMAIVELSGVKPGMTVVDVFGGGGYFTEIFAKAVGPTGSVSLINNPPYHQYAKKGLAVRSMEQRLPNVSYNIVEPDDLMLARVDVALLMMTYHDLFYADPDTGWPTIDPLDFIAQIANALKPGGVLIVSDHIAVPGSKDEFVQSLHRIDMEFAKVELEKSGLVFDGSSDIQRNPLDDHMLSVFDPDIRGKTDRFVMRFVKPR